MTDLVGSTELLRHGPEAFDEIRREHLAAVRRAVTDHRGNEVKSTGDGVMATFTSAADAVASAVAVQQEVHALQRRDGRSPDVRVGLSCGEATLEEGDWYGQPVIEAARLCAAAEGGQVLSTAVVPVLVGSRGGHAFVALGERVLKGFDDPVAVVEVGWAPRSAAGFPLPPIAELATADFVVGRTSELEAMTRSWKQAQTGSRRAVLVAGEPGVGKSSLAAELAAAAHEAGATVLWGRCDEELGVPYQPFVEALRHWVVHAGELAVADALDAPIDRAEIGRLVPELGEATAAPASGAADAEADRYRLFGAVSRLLARIAADAPVLLVLDDVHWAAAPTLQLTRHVIRDAVPAPLLVVGTYRDTELDRTHPLADMLATLRREPNVDRIPLTGLTETGVAEFLDAAAGEALGEPGERLAAAIHAETEGNPFFVGQVLRHLAETGALARVDGRWVTTAPLEELGIPEGVREVVGRRLSRLSDATNQALTVAAVMGRDFDLRTLEEIPEAGDSERLLDAVDEAVAAHLVDEGDAAGQFSFAHALVRQTLLTELTAARRARLHRRIGEALASRPTAAAAVVAHHFCAGATAGAVDDAVRWSLLAMDDAFNRLAFEESVLIGERALHVLELSDDDPGRRGAVLAKLARGILSAGEVERSKAVADEAVDAARRSRDPIVLADAVMARTSWASAGVPDERAGEMLDEAIAGLGEAEPVRRAQLLGIRALYRGVNRSMGAGAVEDARAAVEASRQAGDDQAHLGALFTTGSVLQGTADVDAQLAVVREIQRVEQHLPAHLLEFNRLTRARLEAVVSLVKGDRDGLEAAIAEAREISTSSAVGGVPAAFASMWQAMVDIADGRLDAAEEHANGLLTVASHDINFQNSWASLMFRIAWERGEAGAVLPLVRDAVERTPGLVALQSLMIQALVAAGELDEASELLGRLTADGLAGVPRDVVWSATLAQLSEACTALEDGGAASALHHELGPFSGQLIVTAWGVHCHGAADRYLAMMETLLGRFDDADAHFAAALELEESCRFAALASRTRVRWAQMVAARGGPRDADHAAELAAEALAVAERTGQADIDAAARALLGR